MKQQPLPFAKRSEFEKALRRIRLDSFLTTLGTLSFFLVVIVAHFFMDEALGEEYIGWSLASVLTSFLLTLVFKRRSYCIYDYKVVGSEIELFLINIFSKAKKQNFDVNEIETIDHTHKYLDVDRVTLKVKSLKKAQHFLFWRNGIGQEFMDEVSESASREILERYVSN